MYHFNSMPFHELGVAITFQLKAISENEDNNIFSILCHLRMGSATISILMQFQRIATTSISFTNFLHFLCSSWSYHLIRSGGNKPNEKENARREALRILPFSER